MKITKSALVLAALALTGCNIDYSDGARVGTINKFSLKGIFCKTYEGELNLGGFRNGAEGRIQANVFEFTVRDPSVAAQVEQALVDGCRVKLTYHQVVAYGPCSTDTGYFVTKVEKL